MANATPFTQDADRRTPIQGEVVSDSDRPTGPAPEHLQHLSRWMDSAFEIPGLRWRFGLDALLGLIPGLGDTASALVSLYILLTAAQYRVPRITMARMTLNVALDYLVGALPIVGDIFDVWWKANQKNVDLLRRSIETTTDRERAGARGDWLAVIVMLACLTGVIVLAVMFGWWLLSLLASALGELFR